MTRRGASPKEKKTGKADPIEGAPGVLKTPEAANRQGKHVAQNANGDTKRGAKDGAPKFRRRASARPDEVLDAALKLFLSKGYAATRVEDIAKEAGISKGLVYQYFSSKQALIEGLVSRALAPLTLHALDMVRQFEGDPRLVITMMLAMISQEFKDPRILAIPKLVMREAVSFPEIARAYKDQILDAAIPVLTDLIARGVEQGYFRKVDPELTLRTIMGPMVAHILLSEVFGIEPAEGLCMERLMENHVNILFEGLAADRGSAEGKQK